MSSYFFLHATKNHDNAVFLEELERYSEQNKQLLYVLNGPLAESKYTYDYKGAVLVLTPEHKIQFVDFENSEEMSDFVEDVIEDLVAISDKYSYKDVIGRRRKWQHLIHECKNQDIVDFEEFFRSNEVSDYQDKKKIELIISLFVGSINDVSQIQVTSPTDALEAIRNKIQLFDADQTRFIYDEIERKICRIQGLSGTGKTELLLHKVKDIYLNQPEARLFVTCHTHVLVDALKKRIPKFFNFMKVDQQIEWNSRLWCANSWGKRNAPDSGFYRFICKYYQVPFRSFSYLMSFKKVCELAIKEIKEIHGDSVPSALDYVFIDESQDFDEVFFELAQLVTSKKVYVAGDTFQSIFDQEIASSIEPDYLLGKCYRTDPKTLMFAHALGMGLFESEKLRWLEKREWESCGYVVKSEQGRYILSREPSRRFEDLDDNYESVKIVQSTKDPTEVVLQIIIDIKRDYPTVKPHDIGVVFLDRGRYIYEVVDKLEAMMLRDIQWEVNKAYESKKVVLNKVFVSNRFNVKGLEFPFVICFTRNIQSSLGYRNSLYTMLTRSFLTSYLITGSKSYSGVTEEMNEGLRHINSEGEMVIVEPSEDEKEHIRTRFEYHLKESKYDTIERLLHPYDLNEEQMKKMHDLIAKAGLESSDEDTLSRFIDFNVNFL